MNKTIKHYNDTEEGRQELFQEMKKEYGVNQDYHLNVQLDRLMSNLTTAIGRVDASIYDKPYNYFINNDESFNAFCTLGHNISVNVGLYKHITNEDEIAVVLAHEMGHGQKDHPAKGAKKSLGPAILATATGSVVGNIAANVWKGQGITKPMEWEADNLAFLYLSHSVYNPGACAAVWQRMIDLSGDNPANPLEIMVGGADHPSNTSRRDNYAKLLTKYSGDKVTVEDGIVYIGKELAVSPAPAGDMTSAERAYFVAGNLASAFYKKHHHSSAYADGNVVMLGKQPIIACTSSDESASVIVERINRLK